MVDYKVSLTTKLRPPQKGIIAIEPEDYTAAEVAALKQHAKVLAYLSVGSVSDERPYYKELKPYTLRKLDYASNVCCSEVELRTISREECLMGWTIWMCMRSTGARTCSMP